MSALLQRVRLDQDTKFSNHDLQPVPVEKRTWKKIDWFTYWVSDLYSATTWQVGSSLATLGLPGRVAIPVMVFGYTICGFLIAFSSIYGSKYHVSFPVAVRSSWGMHGAAFPVIARAFLSILYASLLTYFSSGIVQQLLIGLSPDFANFKNHLPASANITSSLLLCFFLVWIVQTPLSMIPVHKLKWLFMVKSIVAPPVFIAIGIWGLVVTKGGGSLVRGSASMITGNKGWSVITGLNLIASNWSTMTLNVSDFTRFAKDGGAPWYAMVPAFTISATIPTLCGYLAADAALELYGELVWSPAELFSYWENRPVKVLAALVFALATIAATISSSLISFSIDAMILCPRYLNVIRGSVIAAILVFVMTPWNIVYNGTTFLNFLNSYGAYFGPLLAVMLTDYYVIRKGQLDVWALYQHPNGRYSYNWGFNFRAYIAFIIGFVPNFPGFLAAIKPEQFTYNYVLYNINYFFNSALTALVYYALCRWIWKLPEESLVAEAVLPDDVFEHNHDESRGSQELSAEKSDSKGGDVSVSPYQV